MELAFEIIKLENKSYMHISSSLGYELQKMKAWTFVFATYGQVKPKALFPIVRLV